MLGDSKSGIDMGFLVGDRVYLRPIESEDLELVSKWVNDPETRGLIGSTMPMSRSEADEWLEQVCKDKDRIWFTVCLRANHRVIGEAGLSRIFPAWRTADLSLIIGQKDAQGQGYGIEAIDLLMDYAFGYMNLHRLSVGVVGFNERAINLYEKAGFKKEGIQRDGYFYNHAYHDFVMMSILEDEYRARKE